MITSVSPAGYRPAPGATAGTVAVGVGQAVVDLHPLGGHAELVALGSEVLLVDGEPGVS